jgi:hypothetical protein
MTNFDDPIEKELAALALRERELLRQRASEAAKRGHFYCTVCLLNPVDAENGFDTCDSCREGI